MSKPTSILFSLLLSLGYTASAEDHENNTEDQQFREIPSSVRFNSAIDKEGMHLIVGSFQLKRHFLGKRATPQYRDYAQFYTFDGTELRRSPFAHPELELRIVELLKKGSNIPAVVSVDFKNKRFGHDGVNMTTKLIGTITGYEATSEALIKKAAKKAKIKDKAVGTFFKSLKPDFQSDKLVVSFEGVSVKSNTSKQGSNVAFIGINVYNSSDKAISVEIDQVKIEQAGTDITCKKNVRINTPTKWEISAKHWANGFYSEGEMAGKLWIYDPQTEIKPKQEVKVTLKLKIDETQSVSISRLLMPDQ